jgi:tRNA G18 (ribose-2'-O)-methylase SpoU
LGLSPDAAVATVAAHRRPLFAAMPHLGERLDCSPLGQECAIAIGAEGRGVGPVLWDAAKPVRIPTAGVESLNAAVAAGILLYEAARQRDCKS